MKIQQFFFGLLTLAFASVSFCAHAGELTVKVRGVSSNNGEVIVTVFNDKNQWLKKAISSQKIPATTGTVEVTFENLPDGEYAISAIHDLNVNGNLDTNAIGMPTEPYGFSNDASGNFGPPSFDSAKFVIDQEKKVISFRVN